MITVRNLKRASGGFGEFDQGEAVELAEFDSAAEYVADAASNGYTTDDETEAAAADAHGRIHNQAGTVVAFRDTDGHIGLWTVEEG